MWPFDIEDSIFDRRCVVNVSIYIQSLPEHIFPFTMSLSLGFDEE